MKKKTWIGYVSNDWFNTFRWHKSSRFGKLTMRLYDKTDSGFTKTMIMDRDRKVKLTIEEI